MTDIIDEIDALVDEQLSGYHDRSGYDYNVNQDRCHHCGREWHGLKITRRMEGMRQIRWYDEDYRYAEDDSTVLCPGSHFIGPWATAPEIAWIRSNNEKIRKLKTDLALGKVFPDITVYEAALDSESIVLTPRSADRVRNKARRSDLRLRPLSHSIPVGDLHTFAAGGVLPASEWEYLGTADSGRHEISTTHRGFDFERLNAALESVSVRFTLIGDTARRALQIMSDGFAEFQFLIDPEPDTRTPQERALPRPSSTPPMWAVDASRQRRTRTNSQRRHR